MSVRETKLSFKGDSKKKKKRKDTSDNPESSTKKDDKDPETWVFPDNPNEIRGPTFLFHPGLTGDLEQPVCVTYDSTRRKITLVPLHHKAHLLDAEEQATVEAKGIKGHIPTETSQVWVTTRVAGSLTINLRTGTGDGKFLSCDAHGLVSADREARGAQEEWTPVIMEGGMVAFQNVYKKYLSIDEVAGGGLQLRGDSDNVGFAERWWCKIQNKYKKEAGEEERKKKEGESVKRKIDEVETNHTFQAWGAGRSVVSNDDNRELKKARNEGRLTEALLDRRSKLKSDRFC